MTDDKEYRQAPVIGMVMGSVSDWPTMQHGAALLKNFDIPHEVKIVSAHRTPERLYEYAKSAHDRGLKAIIAGAGGAAHLPGMLASLTPIPILGVPIESKALSGVDSLYSIVQMPAGVPVHCFAIGKSGAINAALAAISILALYDNQIAKSLDEWRQNQSLCVAQSPENL